MGCADPTQTSPAPCFKHRPTTTGAKQDRDAADDATHTRSTSTPGRLLAWCVPSDGFHPTDLTPVQSPTGSLGVLRHRVDCITRCANWVDWLWYSHHPHDTTQRLALTLGGHSFLMSGLDAAIPCIQLSPHPSARACSRLSHYARQRANNHN